MTQIRGLQSAIVSSIRRSPRRTNFYNSLKLSKNVSGQFRSVSILASQTTSSCRTDTSVLFNNTVVPGASPTFGFRCSMRKETMVTVTKTSASLPHVEITKQSQTQNPNQGSSSSSSPSLSSVQNNDIVQITPSAIQQIYHLAKQRRPDDPSAVFLRVYVDAGGCSGFQYKFELEQKDNSDGDDDKPVIDPEEDVVIESLLSDGSLVSPVTVVIDEGSLEYIKGSTVDFVREMIRSSFAIVENPQSESACGCGSSFAVKNFEANPALD